jgi:hypothetical protein
MMQRNSIGAALAYILTVRVSAAANKTPAGA